MKKSERYFNTIQLSPKEHGDKRKRATFQRKIIMAYFRANRRMMTPLEVWRELRAIDIKFYDTSVRRAITTLTNSGKLEKTEVRVMEERGEYNYKWRLKR
jgi:Fe2+ or Zn2+ uptake regulation protein